jgi:hypothetical protein
MGILKKIDLKLAAYINIAINILAITVHILVILQIIPFNWVSGGKIQSYEIQKQASILSIFILLFTIPISLWGSKIILKNKLIILLKILLFIFCAYSFIGFLMQILGTLFEKIGMSILCLVSGVMNLRLLIEKHKSIM